MLDQIKNILIADYTYELADEKIAKYPVEIRDQSKLLYYKNSDINTYKFSDITDFFDKNDLLIFNNAKVIQARLDFYKETGSKIEIFCLEPHNPSDYNLAFQASETCEWKCMVGNLKKWKNNFLSKEINFGNETFILSAQKQELIGNYVIIKFNWKQKNNSNASLSITFGDVLDDAGKTPLPPYLNRESENEDKNRYQTVYAKNKGSVAAPTAGLHFTDNVLKGIEKKGIKKLELTLHVGAGTFRPVKSESISGHEMHEEHFIVEKSFLKSLIEHHGRVVAVGTTSVRTLESLYWIGLQIINKKINGSFIKINQWEAYEKNNAVSKTESLKAILTYLENNKYEFLSASTQIIIVPTYEFKIVDAMVTNFHQPQSTLLLLVAAMVGNDWRKIYDYALTNNYRFLSYGDSSLIIK
ncbi:MAG: S-adenosylmethionine:tRNA ribosyltransferase-isomerase [Bacteroidales bacterium]|nr:S-adenosylmethionine:tRNA ribosyltransferase-isomerase [Bacteroidales bacterium]MBN2757488.1 S-adenosylmethionine:tRNA ribosyltransferase-isomerase [Bacteroidales bacterium]